MLCQSLQRVVVAVSDSLQRVVLVVSDILHVVVLAVSDSLQRVVLVVSDAETADHSALRSRGSVDHYLRSLWPHLATAAS